MVNFLIFKCVNIGKKKIDSGNKEKKIAPELPCLFYPGEKTVKAIINYLLVRLSQIF